MPQFSLSHLSADQTDTAFGLVRIALPGTRLADWQNYVRSLMVSGGAILALTAPDGGIHALASYMPEVSLRHGRALRVDLFIAFELSRTAPARKALCEGLQTLAKGLGCSTVLYTLDSRGLPNDTQDKVESWLKLGSTIEGVQLAQAAPMAAAC